MPTTPTEFGVLVEEITVTYLTYELTTPKAVEAALGFLRHYQRGQTCLFRGLTGKLRQATFAPADISNSDMPELKLTLEIKNIVG